ncbi:MAG: thioredoxin domain-containing protein [Cellvibrio sp.]
MLARTLALVGCFFIISCSQESQQSPSFPKKTGNAYELQVDPKWTFELRRPLPEILIFNKDKQCVYYSTGFFKDTFANDLKHIFQKTQIDEFDIKSFESEHPDHAKRIREAVLKNLTDHDSEAQQDAYEEALESIASQMERAKLASHTSCSSSISQHLSLLQDLNGNPISWDILEKETFTIIEYWADWCLPCKQQREVIDAFIKEHDVKVTFLHVERDANKLNKVATK